RVSPEVHAASLKAAALSGTSLNRWAEQVLKAAARRSTKAIPGASKAIRLSKKIAGTTQAAR
ncbi:MAG: toxin-antitoxin system HicB family antitoxin, partial [Betaproteobacteria bacterium]